MSDVMVIIPARDEGRTIAEVVRRVSVLGYPVIVVDDASRDSTAEAAARAGAEVLRLAKNVGNLGAIQAGLAWALERSACPWLVTIDADGQHLPEDIPALALAAKGCGSRAVVIGSCPERSSWMRQMAWAFFRKLSGLAVRDMTSGFKVYSRRAAGYLIGRKHSRLGYQCVPSLLFLVACGYKVHEVKVQMAPRKIGASRVFSSWGKVAVYMARVSLKCLAHRPRMALMAAQRLFEARLRLRRSRRLALAVSQQWNKYGDATGSDLL